jgi:hypothetical protein
MCSSWYLSSFSLTRLSSDGYSHQAAIGVSESYNALGDLFECITGFLRHLHVYTKKIQLASTMTDVVVKIVVEVLNVLALATKQITLGRFSKRLIVSSSSLADLVQRNSQRNQSERTRSKLSYSD